MKKDDEKLNTATSQSKLSDGFYCEDEVAEMVEDMEELNEYLYGWPDSVLIDVEKRQRHYKKEYVDIYINR